MIMVIIVVWRLDPVGLGWVMGPQVHLAVDWVGFGLMKWTHGQHWFTQSCPLKVSHRGKVIRASYVLDRRQMRRSSCDSCLSCQQLWKRNTRRVQQCPPSHVGRRADCTYVRYLWSDCAATCCLPTHAHHANTAITHNQCTAVGTVSSLSRTPQICILYRSLRRCINTVLLVASL